MLVWRHFPAAVLKSNYKFLLLAIAQGFLLSGLCYLYTIVGIAKTF